MPDSYQRWHYRKLVRHPTLSRYEELRKNINDYWNIRVTHMKNGVPLAAFSTRFIHPDIIRVRRLGRNWEIVR